MKILFLGDICPTDDYRMLFDDESGRALFNDVREILDSANHVVCNFECPATNEIKTIKKCGPSLKAKPQDLITLKNIGIDAVSLANNHILDYGVKGLEDTIIGCSEQGIDYFGVETNGILDKDRLVLKNGDEIVTVFSFAEKEFNYVKEKKTGAVLFDPYNAFDKIREAKKQGKVVVLYHGGIEYYRYPSPLLRKKCLKMAEAGADAILCQHSHIIGTIERYHNSFILYGQGNSVFGFRENNDSWNKGLTITFDTKEGVSLDVIEAKEDGVYRVGANTKKDIFADVENLSKGWTEEFIEKEWIKFCKKKEALYYPMLYGKNRLFNKFNRFTKNKLFNGLMGKRKKMTTMNLIRCDAHSEVIETLLEKDYE